MVRVQMVVIAQYVVVMTIMQNKNRNKSNNAK